MKEYITKSNAKLLDLEEFKQDYGRIHGYFVSRCHAIIEQQALLAQYWSLATQGDPDAVIELANCKPDIIDTPLFKHTRDIVLQKVRMSGGADKLAMAQLKRLNNLEMFKRAKRGPKPKITVDVLKLRRDVTKIFTEIINLKCRFNCRPNTQPRLLDIDSDTYWVKFKQMEKKKYGNQWRGESDEEYTERISLPLPDIHHEIENTLIQLFCGDTVKAAYQILADSLGVEPGTIQRKLPGLSKILRRIPKNIPINQYSLHKLYKKVAQI